jgi:hypothetical protein
VWVIDASAGQQGSLYRYRSGNWTKQITNNGATGFNLSCVAVNPANTSDVYVADYHGNIQYSTNAEVAGMATWSGDVNFMEISSAIPWMQWSQDSALSIQSCMFDPSQTNVLYAGAGVGVFTTSPPTSGTSTISWDGDQTQGIENLDTTSVRAVSGNVILTAQDRALWQVTPPAYPSRYWPTMLELNTGWNACVNGSTLLALTNYGLAPSTDGGATFGAFVNINGQVAGSCVPYDASHWLWLQPSVGPYYTSDSGADWSACTFTGSVTAGGGGWQTLALDTASSTVLMWNDGGGSTNGSGAQGIWKNTSSTSCSFTKVFSGAVGSQFSNVVLTPVTGCNFFLTGTAYVHGGLPNTASQMYVSTDCGTTWSNIPNLESILSYGFGAPLVGSDGYPTLYCACWVKNGPGYKYGIWQAENIDGTVTWVSLGNGYPEGNNDAIIGIVGDPVTPGTIYGGFIDSGYFWRTD